MNAASCGVGLGDGLLSLSVMPSGFTHAAACQHVSPFRGCVVLHCGCAAFSCLLMAVWLVFTFWLVGVHRVWSKTSSVKTLFPEPQLPGWLWGSHPLLPRSLTAGASAPSFALHICRMVCWLLVSHQERLEAGGWHRGQLSGLERQLARTGSLVALPRFLEHARPSWLPSGMPPPAPARASSSFTSQRKFPSAERSSCGPVEPASPPWALRLGALLPSEMGLRPCLWSLPVPVSWNESPGGWGQEPCTGVQ